MTAITRMFFIGLLTLLSACASETPEGIAMLEIDEAEIQARLLSKAGNETRPLILLLAGSGGSYIRNEALYHLVTEGYDVLSLAYFGRKSLPEKLEQIPVEYVDKAVSWCSAQLAPAGRKVVLLGISRGAELALLYSSLYANVDALIGYSPGCIVLPNHFGISQKRDYHSSWTYQGHEIPFAELNVFDDEAGEVIYRKYIDAILTDRDQLKTSMIGVENISCPVLLLSGNADLVWPSYAMGNLVEQKIKAAKPELMVNHITYPNAGHQFFWFGDGVPEKVTTSQSMRLTGIKKHRFQYGGTREGTQKAMMESRDVVYDFLQQL